MSSLSLPLHPRLVHFPIALLLLGALVAIIYQWSAYPWLRNWGWLSMLFGWLLTIPAIVTGLIDKSELQPGTPADQIADQHTTAIFLMWALFGLALYWQYRWRDDMQQGSRRLIWVSLLILAAIVLLIAGHLGGRLVYEMGIGVRS